MKDILVDFVSRVKEEAARVAVSDLRDGQSGRLMGVLNGLKGCVSSAAMAKILGCSVAALYRRIRFFCLPAHFDGARWKFYGAEVAQWLVMQSEQHRSAISEKHSAIGARDEVSTRPAALWGAESEQPLSPTTESSEEML